MEKKKLLVDGMSCNHCKKAIEKALRDIGVHSKVDLNTKSVKVEFDQEKVSINKIIEEIKDQGYEVKEGGI